ncbi:hypothetical protein CD351_04725 [Erythrobacter sp. KY5]|uniref:serine hydrolase domain-containing protein n=1 Tax=Erythrobacter sp. KY5 TaxID=2011159 RepID=UPI000DBF0550|nr:serine hydrolase domain-containing protein [Erythrobacter sp. KY5]AWW73725.1 hypothetical protein CD351_04725 [Erythrobacter sp. KY5]
MSLPLRSFLSVSASLALGACAADNGGVRHATDGASAEMAVEDMDVRALLTTRFADIAETEDIPAMSIGVVRGGRKAAIVNLGHHDRSGERPVDAQSIYQIASLSKTLTGALVSTMIADGAIDPQRSVASYLGDIVSDDASRQLEAITVENLLQHTAAIPEQACSLYRQREEGEAWPHGYSRAKLVADLDVIKIDRSKVGSFAYSSCGYAVLGLVAESAGGQDFASLLAGNVTRPNGMRDTTVVPDAMQRKRVTTPYRKDDRSTATSTSVMGMATPGSAIYSTLDDLMTFQIAQLAAYRRPANAAGPSPLVLTTNLTDVEGQPVKFGYGLIQLSHPKGTFYLHDGDADGFAAVYVFSPEHDLGLTILTTSGGRWLTDAAIETMVEIIASEGTPRGS